MHRYPKLFFMKRIQIIKLQPCNFYDTQVIRVMNLLIICSRTFYYHVLHFEIYQAIFVDIMILLQYISQVSILKLDSL